VSERRVVLGLLWGREWNADLAATGEQVIRAGPSTYQLP
jgi:hypothetical protein